MDTAADAVNKVLVSGSRGLIGSHLMTFLKKSNFQATPFIRGDQSLEGFDAIVHLQGRSIQTRWTKKVMKELVSSRLDTTTKLVNQLVGAQNPPKVFLSASAIGYYGDLHGATVDESAPKGSYSFLADLCDAWEKATEPLKKRGIRVVNLRFGPVLSPEKGALHEMLKVFKWGLCCPLGLGTQYMSWISIDDAVGAIHHAILHQELEGPVNITAPYPVSNKHLSKEICFRINKSLGPAVPPAILRLLKGRMADELLLSSVKAYPKKLLESGYEFLYPHIEEALSHLMK